MFARYPTKLLDFFTKCGASAKLLIMSKTISFAPRAAGADGSGLIKPFQACLPWNLARVKCFILMVLAVIEQRSVSIQWLSKAGEPGVKSDSLRRRFENLL